MQLYKKPLADIAFMLNYSQSNIYILQNNFKALRAEFPNVWSVIQTCEKNMDRRTPEEYSQDLVASWLYEDTLLFYMQKYGLSIRLNGTDKERTILRANKIEHSADYLVTGKNQTRQMELINSYTPYWGKNMAIDLRNDKFLRMQSDKVLLLCIDVYNREFFIIDFQNEIVQAECLKFHKPYGKPAYRIHLAQISVFDLEIKTLIKVINQHT